MREAAALLSGVLFAVGLGIAGMTDPNKVLAFLDLAGAWDPSLLFVMGGAVTVSFVLFRLARRRPQPLLAPTWNVPTRRDVDAPLVVGSLLFGIGWGIAGFCPGPAIASLGFGKIEALVFVGALVAGTAAGRLFHHADETPTGR